MRKMSHAPPGAFAMTADLAITNAAAVAINADLDHRPSTGHVQHC